MEEVFSTPLTCTPKHLSSSPLACSPKPPLANDISSIVEEEEGSVCHSLRTCTTLDCSSRLPFSSPRRCSLKPASIATDLSIMEEGGVTLSQVSTETIIPSPTNAHKIIAELLGTYIIIFMGCASIVVDNGPILISTVGIAVTWGLSVMVMIYTLGHVSGGHFNPAVTIALAASGKFPWREIPGYVASQIIASMLAIWTLILLFHGTENVSCTATQYTHPTTGREAFAWEFIISFNLMLTICGVATDSRAISELSGVAVGASVLINYIMAGNITKASMNPARSIASALIFKKLHSLWLYIVAPILGTLTACTIYSFLRPPINERCNKESPKSV